MKKNKKRGKKKSTDLLNFLKSMRTYRVLLTLLVMLVSASFANFINLELILLGVVATIIYSAAGTLNAIEDKDHNLPKYSKKVAFIMLIIALVISIYDKIIFLTAFISVLLGFLYNTLSRKVLFGDISIMGITHYALPSISASILLGLDTRLTITLGIYFYVISWFIMHTKNLRGVIQDKKRGYSTPATKFKRGEFIINLFVVISILLMFAGYFLFEFPLIFLIILIPEILILIIYLKRTKKNQNSKALNVLRFSMFLLMLAIIISNFPKMQILLISLAMFLIYVGYFLIAKVKKENGKI